MHPVCLALTLVFAVAAGKRRRSKLPNGSNLAMVSQTPVFAIRQFIADSGHRHPFSNAGDLDRPHSMS